MKIIIKRIAIISLILFLLIQLYQPARNLDYGQDITANFTKVYSVPKNIKTILQTSCYDCHSNYTNYPWYSNIQPVRFLMESHIKEGKENLNFNEWGNYSSRKQNNKLGRIVKEIKSNEMPLSSYTLIHRNAILDATQKELVINWINKITDSLATEN